MVETTLPGLVADLVASRRAGGYRFRIQERVLRQFVDYDLFQLKCRNFGV